MQPERQTILIVDDMPSNIEVLNEILSDDYDILFATNGQDAVNLVKEQNPDLVLLDIIMPGMDGYEVLSQIKSDTKTADIPVIFVTGKTDEEDESRGLNAGVVDYIIKPIRNSIVKARVHNHLELKRYRDMLKALSTVDGLTGIANRRRFDQVLIDEWSRSRRSQNPLSLIMMDIDFFKAFNDHYGHLAGDDCLCLVARRLSEVVRRPADLLARYGGEEFVFLLPETDEAGALILANKVQEKMKILSLPHAFSSVANYVTLSAGVASIIPDDSLTHFSLIKRADEMLYLAKQKGRNQIRFSSQKTMSENCS
jgi:diguanylate cyclase (GGDEF)-like protein